jgi:hypothetical protein
MCWGVGIVRAVWYVIHEFGIGTIMPARAIPCRKSSRGFKRFSMNILTHTLDAAKYVVWKPIHHIGIEDGGKGHSSFHGVLECNKNYVRFLMPVRRSEEPPEPKP